SFINVDHIALTLESQEIYRDLTLHVPESELFFLLGPSGCGKSTLLRLVAGLLEPDHGSIHIKGRPPEQAWHEMAFIFQSPRLVNWRNALDNVTLAGQLRHGGPARR